MITKKEIIRLFTEKEKFILRYCIDEKTIDVTYEIIVDEPKRWGVLMNFFFGR